MFSVNNYHYIMIRRTKGVQKSCIIMVNGLTISAKYSILDVWQGSNTTLGRALSKVGNNFNGKT